MTVPTPAFAVVHRGFEPKAASERALVLNAVGIPSQVRQEGAEHMVVVAYEFAQPALEELGNYERENVDWPPRYEAPPVRSRGRLSAAIYAVLMIAIFPLGQSGAFGTNIWDPGKMHVGSLWSGEFWRAVTPLTLHGDAGHLMGNLISGVAFGMLCAQTLGAGLGWLSILMAGTFGNLLSSSIQPATHTAIGASTAVFGAIGVLSSFEWMRRHTLRHPPMRRYAPLAGGVVLLGYLGAGGERTDVVAHIGGFIAGLGVGVLVAWLRLPERLSVTGQRFAGGLTLALVGLAWAWALA